MNITRAILTFTNRCALSRRALLSAVGSPARTETMLARRRSVIVLAFSIELWKSAPRPGVSDNVSTISCMRSQIAGAESTAASIDFSASLSTSVLDGGISNVGWRTAKWGDKDEDEAAKEACDTCRECPLRAVHIGRGSDAEIGDGTPWFVPLADETRLEVDADSEAAGNFCPARRVVGDIPFGRAGGMGRS